MKTLKDSKLTFIGAGNMAEALVRGLIKIGACTADHITATDIDPKRLAHMEKTFGIRTSRDNAKAVDKADVIILAVKPQIISSALAGLRGSVSSGSVVVSIAAGTRAATIESGLGNGTRVVRVMPNTPALVGAGASAVSAGRWAREEDMALATSIFQSVGIVVRVEEEAMDAVTALSGSGPAYVFYLVEAMLAAAKKCGLDDEVAKKLAYATVAGAARLLAETGAGPAELRERVTSKGGTTAAAIEVLQREGVFEAFVEALVAARDRSKELSGG